jgi:hypothetical protein
MYSITNDFKGILARIPNEGGRKLVDSCAIMGYVILTNFWVKPALEVISLGKYCPREKESLCSIAPTLLQMKIAKTSDKKRKSKENNLETSISTTTSLPSWLWPWPLLGTTILELEERVPVKVPLLATLSIPMTGCMVGGADQESCRGWLVTRRHLLEWKGAVAEHG